MADDTSLLDTAQTLDSLTLKTRDLTSGANSFARAMTTAFASSVTGGKQFDDVLKSLALRISDIAVKMAFKPLENSLSSGLQSLLGGLTGSTSSGASQSLLGGAVVNVHIATPDADSFRRSESYVTGQIARAVSRGQRGL